MVATGKERFRESLGGLEKKDKRSYWFAIIATCAAIVLSILPVFVPHVELEYDPTIAVLTATLIALIWTTYHTFQGVAHSRAAVSFSKYLRSRSREFLSNAVLIESHYLEQAIDLIVKDIDAYDIQVFARPRLCEAANKPDLVRVDAGALISAVDSHLRLIEGDIRLWRDRKQGKTAALMDQSSRLEDKIIVELRRLRSGVLAKLQRELQKDASAEVVALVGEINGDQ